MEKAQIRKILKEVKTGKKSVDAALKDLKTFPVDDIGFAKIDTHRGLRKGIPEVIFCQGKSIKHLKGIFAKRKDSSFILATRASKDIFEKVKEIRHDLEYFESARIIFGGKKKRKGKGVIAIVSAGTADIAVAEEAAVTADLLGNKVERIYDIGVAGIHRMFANHKKMSTADVVIVVAGMEGALASVVGGVVDSPVIAVPTSIGYGASFGGIAPLLTMINSCAPGIAVVNIDNGFGAGYMASLINRKVKNEKRTNP